MGQAQYIFYIPSLDFINSSASPASKLSCFPFLVFLSGKKLRLDLTGPGLRRSYIVRRGSWRNNTSSHLSHLPHTPTFFLPPDPLKATFKCCYECIYKFFRGRASIQYWKLRILQFSVCTLFHHYFMNIDENRELTRYFLAKKKKNCKQCWLKSP